MAPSYPITGINTVDSKGRPHIRKDIDDWYREQAGPDSDRIQLTLFVEALTIMQSRDIDELLSYFRLAGIHSAPFAEWDGEQNQQEHDVGFCVHNNYTFPTWHRVYMVLFEQVVYQAMLEFIEMPGKLPDALKDIWRQQADEWRLPYWDFARFVDRSPPPVVVTGRSQDELRIPILSMMPMVKIYMMDPTGTRFELTSRPNPFYKYTTPIPMGDLPAPYTIHNERIDPSFSFPWGQCVSTTKYGLLDGFVADIWADGGQNWLRSNYALNEHEWYSDIGTRDVVPTLQNITYRLLRYRLENWGSFASTRWDQQNGDTSDAQLDAKNTISLEYIHNNVHNWVGGTTFARPSNPEDLSLWGSGHMSSIRVAAFDPIFWAYHCNVDRLTSIWQALNPDKWFDDEYSRLVLDDPLTPFHKDSERTLYKSNDVRAWTSLHYDYEIVQGRRPGEVRPQQEIKDDIDRLYGVKTKDLYGELPLPRNDKQDYIISILYDRYALDGAPFKINLFFDHVSRDAYLGPESPNFVGSVYNFSSAVAQSNCGNCLKQQSEGVRSAGQVPATAAIRRYIEQNERMPEVLYVVVNLLGQRIEMSSVAVQLHVSRSLFYTPEPEGGEIEFEHVSDGRQAPGFFD